MDHHLVEDFVVVKTSGVDNGSRGHVGVDVGGRSSVLEVALALQGSLERDSDGDASIGHAPFEFFVTASLVSASQSLVVALAVDVDVLLMSLAKLLDGRLDDLHATFLSHGLGRVVEMAASAVPVARDGLGLEANLDSVLLGNSVEQIPGHPEVVAKVNRGQGADLELELARHDLDVDSSELDASVQAGSEVVLSDDSARGLSVSGTAVVLALGRREALGRPAKRPPVELVEASKQGVLLLDGAPWLLSLGGLVDLRSEMSEVGIAGKQLLTGSSSSMPGLADDQDVVSSSQGVLEEVDRSENDLGVLGRSLLGRGAVVGPFRQLRGASGVLL